jgi:hypothetical protein
MLSGGDENISLTCPMRLFPNPANDYIIVTFDPEVFITKYNVLQVNDMKGSVIYSQKLSGREPQYKIPTGTWPKGIYMVSLITGSKSIENLQLVIEYVKP